MNAVDGNGDEIPPVAELTGDFVRFNLQLRRCMTIFHKFFYVGRLIKPFRCRFIPCSPDAVTMFRDGGLATD